MHICRIRYTVLGLLIYYLQNVFSWSCSPLEFEDVASRTVMADIVFEGQPYRDIQIKHKHGFYNIRFKRIVLIKGSLHEIEEFNHKTYRLGVSVPNSGNGTNSAASPKRENQNRRHNQSNRSNHRQLPALQRRIRATGRETRKHRKNQNSAGRTRPASRNNGKVIENFSILVGTFGESTNEPDCVFSRNSVERDKRYLVFLVAPHIVEPSLRRSPTDQSRSSRDRSRSRTTTTRSPPSEIVYNMSSFPKLSSSKLRKEAVNHSCLECHKKPEVTDISKPQNVTIGHRIKIKCDSTGYPRPETIWFKNGGYLEEDDRVYSKSRNQRSTLMILNATEEDTGNYKCSAINVLGKSTAGTLVTIMSRQRKPFSELCHNQDYCFNGGTCYKLSEKKTMFCVCPGENQGERCDEKDTGAEILQRRKKKRSIHRHHFHRFYWRQLRK